MALTVKILIQVRLSGSSFFALVRNRMNSKTFQLNTCQLEDLLCHQSQIDKYILVIKTYNLNFAGQDNYFLKLLTNVKVLSGKLDDSLSRTLYFVCMF